ncbi:MAG: nucleotidyltransferase domain-containing protein [Hungatella sp.]|nr:nucleotidyltransferase domain-containing protein [Hungatella sp.]
MRNRDEQISAADPEKEKAISRLYELLALQKKVEQEFGNNDYNVFIFGSYLNTSFVEGKSDIDIAVYTENFNLYKRLALYLETYFEQKGVHSDIFYIDITMKAPIYCAPLKSKVQFTDYFPPELIHFQQECQKELADIKGRMSE